MWRGKLFDSLEATSIGVDGAWPEVSKKLSHCQAQNFDTVELKTVKAVTLLSSRLLHCQNSHVLEPKNVVLSKTVTLLSS